MIYGYLSEVSFSSSKDSCSTQFTETFHRLACTERRCCVIVNILCECWRPIMSSSGRANQLVPVCLVAKVSWYTKH